MGIHGCEKNGSIVQCLLQYWMKALDECNRTESCRHLESVFAKGDGAIDVRDEAFGEVIIATSFDDYDRQWEAVTEDIENMNFELVGDSTIDVNTERAIINFELVADGVKIDGSLITPRPHWKCEHEWRQFDGEWRIVRERLKAVETA